MLAENTMKPTMQIIPQAILIHPVNSPPNTMPKPEAAIAMIETQKATGYGACEFFESVLIFEALGAGRS